MKTKTQTKDALPMKSDEFDQIMQRALSVAPKPVMKPKSKRTVKKSSGISNDKP